MGSGAQYDMLAVQPNQLGNPQTSLGRNQEQGSIPVPDPGGRIHYGEQGVDFFSAEKLDRPS
jgi:hypothetical protein